MRTMKIIDIVPRKLNQHPLTWFALCVYAGTYLFYTNGKYDGNLFNS